MLRYVVHAWHRSTSGYAKPFPPFPPPCPAFRERRPEGWCIFVPRCRRGSLYLYLYKSFQSHFRSRPPGGVRARGPLWLASEVQWVM